MKKWAVLNIGIPLFLKLCMPDGRAGLWPLILIDMFLLPGCLVCLNAIAVVKARLSVLVAVSLALIGLIVGSFTGYVRWGVSSEKMFNPDGETLWIVEKIFIYQLTFVLVGLLLATFIRWILYKKRH